MIPVPTYLENHQLVTDVYGRWPSFHDAEVHSVLLSRNRPLFEGVSNARIELVIHCFDMTSETDAEGYYRLINHRLVHFEFSEVEGVTLEDFNHQNVIFGLIFKAASAADSTNPRFKVILDHCFGAYGEFTAAAGRVLSVTPCDKEGIPAT